MEIRIPQASTEMTEGAKVVMEIAAPGAGTYQVGNLIGHVE